MRAFAKLKVWVGLELVRYHRQTCVKTDYKL